MKLPIRKIDEPNKSDGTFVASVEDLICGAFGAANNNAVNFKLVQTILHILARQLRLLEQDVEIKFDELGIDFENERSSPSQQQILNADKYEDDHYDRSPYSSGSSGSEDADGRGARKGRGKKGEQRDRGEKEEKGEKEERGEKEKKKDKKGKHEKGEKDIQDRSKDKRREDEGAEREGRGGRHRRGEDDKDEGGEDGSPGRQDGGPKRRGEDDKDEGGKPGGPGQQQGGTQRRYQDDKDEGGKRGGPGQQRGGPQKRDQDGKEEGKERQGRRQGERSRRGEDDGDEGDERQGRRRGGRSKRGEDDGDEGDERQGRRRGGRSRRGEDDGDEGDERQGRRLDGRSRDREDRERRGDRHGERRDDRQGERRDDRHGERRGDRRGGKGGEYDGQGGLRLGGREGSGTSITVTEAPRKSGSGATDKVLVAERGPAKQGRVARVGSIEVVTASQFSLLAKAVQQLELVTGPLPVPALPANPKLRADLAKGRASLSDTMEAMQLNKRVQAAEEGLSRMAGLLTQLTAAGALPGDFASRIGELQLELRTSSMAGQEAAAHGLTSRPGSETTHFADDSEADEEGAGAGTDQGGGGSTTTGGDGGGPAEEPVPANYGEMPVTHNEMQNILDKMKQAIVKIIQDLTARANHSADIASNTTRNVSEKLNIALSLDERINILFAQTADYTEQLNGFDTGLTTQMTSFQEQMTMMRNELRAGLEMLESANNNAETTAILDLTERYQHLVLDLDTTVHLHTNLNIVQQQISSELKSIVECVEMLREQKSDRDEVLDGLRDKADMSLLTGLLHDKDFAQARFEIEKRIQKSYVKFNKQDELWQMAMRDLKRITEHKAELLALMAFKDQAMMQLNDMQTKLRQLETMLGEPQAALLTRKLAAGAACGACLAPAIMPLQDATHGKPALLPALPHPPPGAELPCHGEIVLRPPDPRKHICHRWVGGSHTLMAGNVLREIAEQSPLDTVPFKKYEGYGSDGRLYMMEEEMQPCGECNKFSTDEVGTPLHSPTPTGAGEGDQGAAPLSHHPQKRSGD